MSLMYCPQCEQKDPCQSCFVGWILNSDMTCTENKVSGKTPIGVVFQQTITLVETELKCQGGAVALSDLSPGTMNWRNASSQSKSYTVGGISGWYLPSEKELYAINKKIGSIQGGLTKAVGTQFRSDYYWSSYYYYTGGGEDGYAGYWIVNPVSGNIDKYIDGDNYYYARPVLTF